MKCKKSKELALMYQCNIQPFGDSAILINFEQAIREDINAKVIALTKRLENAKIQGIKYWIPAYCSLTIGYDCWIISYEKLVKEVKKIIKSLQEQPTINNRFLEIPVCYEPPYALDFEEVTKQTDLSETEIIKLHTTTTFRVYMLGFVPGFTYMGRVPKSLFCSRRKTPRLRVPAQSVGLAGYQTGIYPSILPGGWQIIGRTPLKIFDSTKENPFLFQAGDKVKFYAISKKEMKQFDY